MKKNYARILALCLSVLCLSGCSLFAPVEVQNNRIPLPPETEPTQPQLQQVEMPQDQLELALANIDLSMLCAGLDLNNRVNALTQLYYNTVEYVAYSDYDADGLPEVLVPMADFIFDLSQGHVAQCNMVQSPPVYHTDKDGNIYRVDSMGDTDFLDLPGGNVGYRVHLSTAYSRWIDGQWQSVISYYGQVEYAEDGSNFALSLENLSDPSRYNAYEMNCEVNGQACTMKQLWEHTKQIELTPVATPPEAFTQNRFDAACRDSLMEALDTYLLQNYPTFSGSVCRDIDGDGQDEYVFVIPDFDDVWYSNMCKREPACHDPQIWYPQMLSRDYSRTAVLLADTQDGALVVNAYCMPESLSVGEEEIRVENNFLWLADRPVFMTGSALVDAPAAVYQYLVSFGLQDVFIRSADVADMAGEEHLAVARRNGDWVLILFTVQNGHMQVLYMADLSESAVYLVEKDGKLCLMVYTQDIFTLSNGVVHTEYSYNLLRFDAEGQLQKLDGQRISYNDDDQDATEVAAFFEKLNVYLLKIIVVCDPYQLTGKQWMDPSQVQHGTAPEEPQQPQEGEKPVMGFVQIQDPSSWLNLREGPGTQYARVLIDPTNPESYVRQAQGAPVTVLETIETDDPENPVWLKIRITYAGREIIGYSSKTYIRIAE